MSQTSEDNGLALSVHGPRGVLDLFVPYGASVEDVAREYAKGARLTSPPRLFTRSGTMLTPERSLEEAGVGAGSLLVAVGEDVVTSVRRRRSLVPSVTGPDRGPSALAAVGTTIAVALAGLAAYLAARLPDSVERTTTIWILAVAAGVSVLPLGRFRRERLIAAPAFAAAAAYVVTWQAGAERLPTILGVAALTGAVTAAVARSLNETGEESLRVWMVAGIAGFVLPVGGALIDLPTTMVWSLVLIAAMLAVRFVPMLSVDVPDQYLIDFDRLAVTAWTARERPAGRRGRIVVPRSAVDLVAERSTQTMVGACTAVLVACLVAAPSLAMLEVDSIDRIGVRCLLGFTGSAIVFSARSFRNAPARTLLRMAGLWVLGVLAVDLLSSMSPGWRATVAGAALALGILMIVVAVAVGRGWRSAWWSRRAEIGEALSGAFALASLVVASGLFRNLWEITSSGLGG